MPLLEFIRTVESSYLELAREIKICSTLPEFEISRLGISYYTKPYTKTSRNGNLFEIASCFIKLTWFDLVGFSLEDNILRLVSMEPTYVSIVDFKVVLSHWVGGSNSVEDRVRSVYFDQIDPSCNCHGNSGLRLEFSALEISICAPHVGDCSTVVFFDVGDKGTGVHLGIVVEARLIVYGGPDELLKIEIGYKTL